MRPRKPEQSGFTSFGGDGLIAFAFLAGLQAAVLLLMVVMVLA